jgi:hypothetical protein
MLCLRWAVYLATTGKVCGATFLFGSIRSSGM